MSERFSEFKWDEYSDQPAIISDKALKKRLRLSALSHHLRSFATSAIVLPAVLTRFVLGSHNRVNTRLNTDHFFGLCVNSDKEPAWAPALIEDLGVKHILVRVPLSDIERLDRYIDFIRSLGGVTVCVNILQDRRHAVDHDLLRASLRAIFKVLSSGDLAYRIAQVQIGNAINRLKWAFVSVEDYLAFYQVAQNLRDSEFPALTLVGSSVIDFEPISTLRSLFHGFSIRYDKVAALLYVDRRGAPENKQYLLFDLRNKIRFIMSAIRLSPKSNNKLLITEANWPLVNTWPYSPASDECCVSETEAAQYLVRYYLQALSTGMVETVYWHQLIAPGYGLMDNRKSPPRKHPAYFAFKTMLRLLQNAELVKVESNRQGRYCTTFCQKKSNGKKTTVSVHWSVNSTRLEPLAADEYVDLQGEPLPGCPDEAGPAPFYAIKHH